MTKIAVLGGCVSRDPFNSIFVPEYRKNYQCICHQNQMSMISLTAQPIKFEISNINNLETFDRNHFISELEKNYFDTLILNKPEYIILDFYADVFYGARKINNSYITNKRWLFSKSDLYGTFKEAEELTIYKNREEFFLKWKTGVKCFLEFLSENIPDCKVILNKARFVDEYICKQTGEIKLISKSGVSRSINVGRYNYW